ncbi:MAG: HlyD family efflux transporter periplasmic adaptor subunit [Aristaeellaceae bacterium]
MKKFLAMLLLLTMLSTCALADTAPTDCAIANGNVTAARFVDVTAPFSGTLASFDLNAGDQVAEGNLLFSLLTTTVYAPEAGTVKAIFAQPGEDASAAMNRYGGVIALEPTQIQRISATTSGAFNKEANRILHVGETLYFRSAKGDQEEGYGQVIAVNSNGYVVDILDGEFDLQENLNLYRDDGYAAKDCVGKGVVTRRDPVMVQGQGRIASVLVAEGETVTAGQALFTLMAADADADAHPDVTAPAAGVIASVAVSAGQQVWKGQLLARIYLTDEIEVVADVDEMDLNGLRVGDNLSITLDTDESTIITGRVTEISALGVTRQNAAYYTVHVSIPADSAALGASASVYIPRR